MDDGSALIAAPKPDARVFGAVRSDGARAKVRVLYIVPPTKTYAGIERVIDEIGSELAEKYRERIETDVLFTSHFQGHPIGARAYNKIQTDTKTRWGLVSTVRRIVMAKDYDLVIVPQVEATALFWLACLGTKSRFILYLHGNPKLEMRSFKARMLFALMHRIVLRRLAAVFGTSPKQLAAFRTMFPSEAPHVWAPNPVRKFQDVASGGEAGAVTFVNVGRFSYQKGQDLLLLAFAKLHKLRPNARLRIVGYGPSEPELRRSIIELGLDGAAWIEHHPDDPQPALAASDVYVSSSRWEGWSLVICEALRFGLPVVAADCEFGPSDILIDQRLGRLAPLDDADALVATMLHYCDHLAAERRHAEYRKEYIDRFSAENVVQAHADAIALASR